QSQGPEADRGAPGDAADECMHELGPFMTVGARAPGHQLVKGSLPKTNRRTVPRRRARAPISWSHHCRTAHPLIDQEVTVAASTGSGSARPAKIRIRHLQQAKEAGRPFSMLTAYDQFSARAFEAAGIEALLVGDTVGTTVLGHSSTTATTHQNMLTFTGAVARSVHRPLLVADLAFGTYEAGPMDAVHHAVELVRAGAE